MPERKFTDDQVNDIRNDNRTLKLIGQVNGVSAVAIFKIKHLKTYKNVPPRVSLPDSESAEAPRISAEF